MKKTIAQVKEQLRLLRQQGREAAVLAKDPAFKRLAIGGSLIAVGALGAVSFFFVAIISRAWLFSLQGLLASVAIACFGVFWLLREPDEKPAPRQRSSRARRAS